MAHNLNMNTDGTASMAYFGKRPWTGLGLEVPGLMTSREAIIAAKLDWHIDLKEMFVKGDFTCDANGDIRQVDDLLVPEAFATVRRDTNKVLGIVGGGYKVVQNTEAFEFFDSALGSGQAAIETAGALGNGERVWAAARIPGSFDVVPGDMVENFLILSTSHDGSAAIKCFFSPVRVVCQNTLALALKGSRHTVSVKHTKNVSTKLKLAKDILNDNATYWTKLQESLKFMASKQMDKADVTSFLKKLFPGKKLLDDSDEETTATRTENMRIRIETLFDGQAIGANLAGKTRYGMLNAITHYLGHEREGRARKNGREVSMWENEIFGLSVDLREKAGELLLADA